MSKYLITEISIYPVKSLGGVLLTSAKVLPKGLEHDRRWMLVDGGNKFMTQRNYPKMALFKISANAGNFSIRNSDQSIDLPLLYNNEPISAVVWDDTVEVFEVSNEHSNWFSAILGMKCRLVAFPEDKNRPVDPLYAKNDEQVSLADGYPLLIIGEQSLHDLNRRLKEPVPMNGFVPILFFRVANRMKKINGKIFGLIKTGL